MALAHRGRGHPPFVSVHELRDGAIVRWWDYWDLQTLMGAAPAWWIEHMAQGYT